MIARKMLDFAYGSSIATVGFAALGFNLALFRPVRSRHVALICFSAVSVLSVLVLVLVRETLLAASVSTQTFRWLSRPSDFGGSGMSEFRAGWINYGYQASKVCKPSCV